MNIFVSNKNKIFFGYTGKKHLFTVNAILGLHAATFDYVKKVVKVRERSVRRGNV